MAETDGTLAEQLAEEIVSELMCSRWCPRNETCDHPGSCDERDGREFERIAANVLSFLSARGRLVPDGAEVEEQWGCRLTWTDGRGVNDWQCDGRTDAEDRVAWHQQMAAEQPGWLVRPMLIRRTKAVAVTPWEPVPTAGEATDDRD
jgi:hypothetical protein